MIDNLRDNFLAINQDKNINQSDEQEGDEEEELKRFQIEGIVNFISLTVLGISFGVCFYIFSRNSKYYGKCNAKGDLIFWSYQTSVFFFSSIAIGFLTYLTSKYYFKYSKIIYFFLLIIYEIWGIVVYIALCVHFKEGKNCSELRTLILIFMIFGALGFLIRIFNLLKMFLRNKKERSISSSS